MVHFLTLGVLSLLGVAFAQQVGTHKEEAHPEIFFATCTKTGGCTRQDTTLTMDAQWRWLHDARENSYENCIQGAPPTWHDAICSGADGCAKGCALEGITSQDYKVTYGVHQIPGGVTLDFKTGESIGSRLYMMEDKNTYKLFKLLNREFTFDVDVSKLHCGINGAVYFVEMQADGGKGEGHNMAGAHLGTGYCDAQCPHDLKFIGGKANYDDWHEIKSGPVGRHGSCCAEMDIWEASNQATAFTTHACNIEGPLRCEGTECGDTPEDCDCCGEPGCECCGRYKGVCDKDGCDFNPFRLGSEDFYGKGPGFTIDTDNPMTVVTQFLTSDGTDTGDLVEIRRLYVQDDKVIANAQVQNLGGDFQGDSITDAMCAKEKEVFENPDDFSPKGNLKGMGKSLARGMVLTLSLWDDMLTEMTWLDSRSPLDKPADKPGVTRGPCQPGDGNPGKLRREHADASVSYSYIMLGEINSTFGSSAKAFKGGGGSSGGAGSGCDGCGEREGDNGHSGGDSSGHSGGAGSDGSSGPDIVPGPECCTAALRASDPCNFCWRGAALATGWCAQSEHQCTSHCGGTWCENGATKHFELQPALPVSTRSKPRAAVAAAAATLPLLALPALLLLATRRRRASASLAVGAPAPYEPLRPAGGTQ